MGVGLLEGHIPVRNTTFWVVGRITVILTFNFTTIAAKSRFLYTSQNIISLSVSLRIALISVL